MKKNPKRMFENVGRNPAAYVLNAENGLVFDLLLRYLAFIPRGIASDGMGARIRRS